MRRRLLGPLILSVWAFPGAFVLAGDATLPSAIAVPKGPHLPSSVIPTTVDNAGQAIVDLEIEVPWAPKGAPAPGIHLRYESHAFGDGLLGRGWSLMGLTSIRRVQHEGISTEASSWMIEGAGTGAPLETQSEGYWRQSLEEEPLLVEFMEDRANLYDAQGILHVHGHPVLGEGHLGRLELTEIRDPRAPSSNVLVEWSLDHRPLTITKHDHRLVFEYEPRDLLVTTNAHGALETQTFRIYKIRVQHHQQDLWTYVISYGEGDTLLSIQKEALGVDLPAFRFEYGAYLDTPEAVGDLGLNPSEHLGLPTMIWEDHDRDGDPDLVRTSPGMWEIRENKGGTMFGEWLPQAVSPSWDVSVAGIHYADIDRDGSLEILYASPGGLQIHSQQGVYLRTDPAILPAGIEVVDFDGDHRVDFVAAAKGIAWTWTPQGLLTPVTFEPFGEDFGGWRRWVDLNGDGIADLLSQHPEGDLMWSLHRGRGHFEPTVSVGWSFGKILAVGDLDGDLQADFVVQRSYGMDILHQDGSLWRSIEMDPISTDTITISDVDADGHPEILRSGEHGWGVWRLAGPSTGKLLQSAYGGATTTFTYAPMPSIVQGVTLPYGQSLVSHVQTRVPLGSDTLHTYAYTDSLYDAAHASPFGHRLVVETSEGTEHVEGGWTSTEYETSWDLRGRIRVEETPSISVESVWEVAGRRIQTSEVFRMVRGQASLVTYEYDTWGNLLIQASQGALDLEGDEITVTQEILEPTTWTAPKHRVLRETKEGVDRRVRFWMYDGGYDPILEGVGEGEEEEIRGWMAYEEGLRVSLEDGEGTVLASIYDSEGKPLQEAYDDGEGNILTFGASYEDALGLPHEVQTPEGVLHGIRYDALGRTLEVSRNGRREVSYRYHDLEACTIVETVGSLSHTIVWTNHAGEAVQSVERTEDGWVLRQTSFESGLPAVTFYPSYLQGPVEYTCTLFSNSSPSSQTWYSFDQEPLKVSTPGNTVHFEYSEGTTHKWSEDDALRGSPGVTMRYDGQGREIEIDYYGEVYAYAWSSGGEIFAVTDPLGHRRSYFYDSRGDLRGIQDPDAGLVRYDYDGRANLIQTETYDEVLSYGYDGFGRLVQVMGDEEEIHRLDYNDRGLVGRYVDQGEGTLDLEYDDFGRMLSKRRQVDGYDLRVGYEYDAENNVARILAPVEGVHVDLRWGGAHRLLEVVGYIPEIHYAPSGEWSSLRLTNGMTVTRDFDAQGYETTRDVGDWYLRTKYDARHNTLERSTPLHQDRFEYDARSQLVQWDRGEGRVQMTYAPDGTRLSSGGHLESVQGSHRLIGATYTPGGKIRTKEDVTYRYDALGRVVTLEEKGRTEHYRYDYSHHPYQSWTTDADGVVMQHRVHEDPLEVRDGSTMFWIPGPIPMAQPLE